MLGEQQDGIEYAYANPVGNVDSVKVKNTFIEVGDSVTHSIMMGLSTAPASLHRAGTMNSSLVKEMHTDCLKAAQYSCRGAYDTAQLLQTPSTTADSVMTPTPSTATALHEVFWPPTPATPGARLPLSLVCLTNATPSTSVLPSSQSSPLRAEAQCFQMKAADEPRRTLDFGKPRWADMEDFATADSEQSSPTVVQSWNTAAPAQELPMRCGVPPRSQGPPPPPPQESPRLSPRLLQPAQWSVAPSAAPGAQLFTCAPAAPMPKFAPPSAPAPIPAQVATHLPQVPNVFPRYQESAVPYAVM